MYSVRWGRGLAEGRLYLNCFSEAFDSHRLSIRWTFILSVRTSQTWQHREKTQRSRRTRCEGQPGVSLLQLKTTSCFHFWGITSCDLLQMQWNQRETHLDGDRNQWTYFPSVPQVIIWGLYKVKTVVFISFSLLLNHCFYFKCSLVENFEFHSCFNVFYR